MKTMILTTLALGVILSAVLKWPWCMVAACGLVVLEVLTMLVAFPLLAWYMEPR
jgi:hypothetical protein